MKRTAIAISVCALALAGTVSSLSAHQSGPMMGGGSPGGGWMMNSETMGPGMMMGGGMMGHGMMHMMIVMMDADGDGAVSVDEFQAVHARMFDAMDLDHDGKLTSDEMQEFMWSGSPDSDGE